MNLQLAVKDSQVKWFTEFGHLNRGDMLTSEQHRCHNEKKKFQRRV
ncbi:transposase [Escherichia coli]|nr:transposase [Escherichia coli]